MNRSRLAIVMTWGLLGLALGACLLLSGNAVVAQTSTRYVATSGEDSGVCTEPVTPCRTVQYAVDAANEGDVIKVAAGRYTDINNYGGPFQAQVVYVDKTITIGGGYTTTNSFADPPDPDVHPTTLDAQQQGRVIHVTGDSSPTITGLRVTGGRAAGLHGGYWDEGVGGGIYIDEASATLSDNSIYGNWAYSGGGLYLHSSDAVLENNVVSDNLSYGSGPLPAGGGGAHLLDSAATLQGNTLMGNRAPDGSGGGVKLYNSDEATLRGNTFVANIANIGGGLYLFSSDAFVEGNTFLANSAGHGAGLAVSGSSATLANNLVASNLGSVGSGLYVEGSSLRLLHSTIAGSSGINSGIWIEEGIGTDFPSTVWLTNTILVSHTVGITVAEGNTATLVATLWGTATWANDADWDGAGTISTDTVNFWEDPAFVNPGAWDYHLGPGSAATDAGLEAGTDEDLDGEARPIGAAPDIGADEAGVLVRKGATPARVWSGTLLTYTVRVTNTSKIDLQATITDLLPLHVTTTQPLVWTPLITACGGIWAKTLAVTVEQGYAGRLTNRVQVSTDEGARGTAAVMVVAILRVYLPVVLRDST